MGRVLVVGGGISGIVASLELLSAGWHVTLVDRDREENFGGLAKESFGGIFVVDTPEQRRAKVVDMPEKAFADWCRFGELDPADTLPWQWAEAYVGNCRSEVYDWLKARGVGFLPIPHWIERKGNSVPRFHIVWGTGRELATVLVRHLREHPAAKNLTLHFGHKVEALDFTNGSVSGCRGIIEASGQPFEFVADAVLLAGGGINGSQPRIRENWHRDWGTPPTHILNGSHRHADGTLHDAVSAIGGRVTHLDNMWDYAAGIRHWQPRKDNHGLSLVPPRSALWLDGGGRRFAPPLVTGFDTRDLVTRIANSGHGHSWQILNRKIALKELAISGAEWNPSIRDKKKLAFLRDMLFGNRWLVDTVLANSTDVVTATTLEELVRKMNALEGNSVVSLDEVNRAVADYDAAIDRGAPWQDAQLQTIALLREWRADKLRTCKFQKILDPGAGPLIAIREYIVSRKSLGGMQTNLDGQIVGASGTAIPGLYAAGEATGFGGGGMHGLRALEGTFLGGCIFSARRAAQGITGRTS